MRYDCARIRHRTWSIVVAVFAIAWIQLIRFLIHVSFDPVRSVLEGIDQLAVEFHSADKPDYAETMLRLKRFFYIANLHFNNYSCNARIAPFPAWAYEVLLVNKRLGVPDPSGKPPALAANAPNDPDRSDCQAVDASPGPTRNLAKVN